MKSLGHQAPNLCETLARLLAPISGADKITLVKLKTWSKTLILISPQHFRMTPPHYKPTKPDIDPALNAMP